MTLFITKNKLVKVDLHSKRIEHEQLWSTKPWIFFIHFCRHMYDLKTSAKHTLKKHWEKSF